jgi:hypothetical protein
MESSRDEPGEPTNATDLLCGDCGQSFSTPTALESHSTSVHGLDGSPSKLEPAPAFNQSGGPSAPAKETEEPRGSSDYDNGHPGTASRPPIEGANAKSPARPEVAVRAPSDALPAVELENREWGGEKQVTGKANPGWIPRDTGEPTAKDGTPPKSPQHGPPVKESKGQVPPE